MDFASRECIESGKAVMGIELGSTRIKVVLIDERFRVIAQGSHEWANRLVDGMWSYSLEAVEKGVRDAFAQCATDVFDRYGLKVMRLGAIGVSGMMHGYLAFGSNWEQLVPFRSWRNVMTGEAAARLTKLFGFRIPQRWSIAHYAHALMNRESHVQSVCHLSTLAGYVHRCLCGENAVGIGEASGIFPVDTAAGDYNAKMIKAFDAEFGDNLRAKLPHVVRLGDRAGVLTDAGAKWLDPTGTLRGGALMAPPEGDAGTGMVATNSVSPGRGCISAGTSIFAMVVMDSPLHGVDHGIDVMVTPSGYDVALVHCNNCTNEINAWKGLFSRHSFEELFTESLNGDPDCGGVVVVPYLASEPAVGVENSRLEVVRSPESHFTLANFFRAQIYSAFVAFRSKIELLRNAGVKSDSFMAHGGIFTTKGVAQQYLADALNARISCAATAGEGGPWGMAVLAAYMLRCASNCGGGAVGLAEFLSKEVFVGVEYDTLSPSPAGVEGFNRYVDNFRAVI